MVCAVQRRDGIFCDTNDVYDLKACELSVRGVVGSMAKFLQVNEIFTERLYFRKKGAHLPSIVAALSSLTMLKCAVSLPPSRAPIVCASY